MTASAKIVSLGVLTFFMMGLSTYFQQGSFIVPYPFISEFTFVTIIVLIVQSFKAISLSQVVFFFFALFGVLSGRFLWETFLTFDNLVWLFESSYWIEVFKVLQFLMLATLIGIQLKIRTSIRTKILQAVSLLLLTACLLLNNENFIFGWFIFYGIVSYLSLFGDKSKSYLTQIQSEFFTGLGVIYLLSIISITLNS